MSDFKPKISVILLTYNREMFVSRAVDSVLAQTFRDFELVLIDNGSTDHSGIIADEYAKFDKRVRVIHRQRGNIGSGRNAGLTAAKGEWITFIDDDDYCEADYLECLYNLAEVNSADIAVCGSWRETEGVRTPKYVYDETYVFNNIQAVKQLLRRRYFNSGNAAKLFKYELFQNVRYHETGNYDDIYVAYKLFAVSHRVAVCGHPKYIATRHRGNNSGAATDYSMINDEWLSEYAKAFQERTQWLSDFLPQVAEAAVFEEYDWMKSMRDKILQFHLEEQCEKFLRRIFKMKMFTEEYQYLRTLAKSHQNYSAMLIDSKQVVMWGAGGDLSACLSRCTALGANVVAVIDKNKQGEAFGLPIIKPDDFQKDYNDATVFVSSSLYEMEILKALADFEVRSVVPFSFMHQMSIEEFESKYLDGYSWAYNFFEDDVAKQLILDKIRLYLTAELLKPNTQSPHYFPTFLELGNEEVFIDCGANIGDTVKEFLAAVHGQYQYIYAYEPSKKAYSYLTENKLTNFSAINKGCFSKQINLVFYDNESRNSSFVISPSSAKEVMIPCTSLDEDYLNGTISHIPTFIKMDIEGCEKEALVGAHKIIGEYKPKLAICIYHKPEDMYELIETIRSIRSDYTFKLLQHAYSWGETILYAY